MLGDAGRVRQILLNLVGNAVKFTESGLVSVRADRVGEEPIIFSVEDSGIGIREERLAHVFEAFVQEDACTTRRFGGTGLGLTISRMLAEAMGGDITVRSKPGEGSTFTVSLDLPAASASPARTREAGSATTDVLRDKRILVAENGIEAVDAYRDFRPDAILMDMSMPRMDGLEATREIVRLQALGGARCPIIGLTANAFAEDRERCLAAGMSAFLSKPIRKNMLLSSLAETVTSADREIDAA